MMSALGALPVLAVSERVGSGMVIKTGQPS